MTRPKPPRTEMHAVPKRNADTLARHDERHGHRVAVVPPIARLLQSLEAVTAAEIDRMLQRQAEGKQVSARDIDSLSSAISRCQRTQRAVDEAYDEDMQKASEDELAELATGERHED